MTQQLRSHTAVAEDFSSVLNTQIRWLKTFFAADQGNLALFLVSVHIDLTHTYPLELYVVKNSCGVGNQTQVLSC